MYKKSTYSSRTAAGAPGTYVFTDPTLIRCSRSNLDSLLLNAGGSFISVLKFLKIHYGHVQSDQMSIIKNTPKRQKLPKNVLKYKK